MAEMPEVEAGMEEVKNKTSNLYKCLHNLLCIYT